MKRLLPTLLLLILPALALAGPLARTGQTTIYATSDDGSLQKGLAWPATRFTASNGTVTDSLTGLVWLQNANCTDTVGSIAKASGTLTWANALTWSSALANGSCGLTDGSTAGQWRLPNVTELESLIDLERSNPSLPTSHLFSDVKASNYWSSTSYALSTTLAWNVSLSSGMVGFGAKTGSYSVLAVRGDGGPSGTNSTLLQKTGQTISHAVGDDGAFQKGALWPATRFTDNGNGTVTDNHTGLVWLKDAGCLGTQTWASALTTTSTLVSPNPTCTLTDGSTAGLWRLPNRRELASLADRGLGNPALFGSGAAFSNEQHASYWTSSTYDSSTGNAWILNVGTGYQNGLAKTGSNYVWAVRDPTAAGPYTLTVTTDGTGTGTVTSAPAGINCPGTCSANFTNGQVVALTATPAIGTFTGWSGDLTGAVSPSNVTMNAARSVTATFTAALTCAPPTGPHPLPATHAAGSYTVSWGASSTPGAAYQLEESVNGGGWGLIASPATTSFNVTGRTSPNIYSYRVRATLGGYTPSAYTGTVSTTVTNQCVAPTNLSAPANNATGSYTVSWTASSTPGVSYVLEEKIGAGSWAAVTMPDPTKTYHSFSGKSAATYSYQVKATLNPYTDSAYSATASTVVALACAVPTRLYAPAATTLGSYQVSWRASSTPGVSYTLQEKIGAGSWANVTMPDPTRTYFNVTGKSNGITYSYQVKATKSGYADSAWTGPVSTAVTGATVAPPKIYAPATNTIGSYTVSWAASSTPGVTYTLEEATNNTFTLGLRTAYTGTTTRAAITGRSNGVTYYYRVKAGGPYPDSAWTGPVSTAVTWVCTPPANIYVPATDDDGSYTVLWGVSRTPGVTYVLEEATNSGFTTGVCTGLPCTFPGTVSNNIVTQSVTGRTSNTYYYRVKATKASYTDSTWKGPVSIAVTVP